MMRLVYRGQVDIFAVDLIKYTVLSLDLSHQYQSNGRLLKNSNWISQDLMEGLQFDDVAQLENTFYV